jgi:hypothetical protein
MDDAARNVIPVTGTGMTETMSRVIHCAGLYETGNKSGWCIWRYVARRPREAPSLLSHLALAHRSVNVFSASACFACIAFPNLR